MSKNSKVVRAPKRQRADNGKAKPKAGGKRRSSGGTRGEKAYWDKLGAEFEVSSEEDKNEWSDSDEETEEVRGDGVNYMKIAGDDEKQDEQDTASAIVRRWKQAQQKQQFPNLEAEVKAGEKRKIEAVTAADEDEDDDDELPETDEFENVNGEQDGEEEAKAEGEGQEDDDEEEMEAEEVPRVRKGPGSVSFAMVLGKLLSPEGEVAPQAEVLSFAQVSFSFVLCAHACACGDACVACCVGTYHGCLLCVGGGEGATGGGPHLEELQEADKQKAPG